MRVKGLVIVISCFVLHLAKGQNKYLHPGDSIVCICKEIKAVSIPYYKQYSKYHRKLFNDYLDFRKRVGWWSDTLKLSISTNYRKMNGTYYYSTDFAKLFPKKPGYYKEDDTLFIRFNEKQLALAYFDDGKVHEMIINDTVKYWETETKKYGKYAINHYYPIRQPNPKEISHTFQYVYNQVLPENVVVPTAAKTHHNIYIENIDFSEKYGIERIVFSYFGQPLIDCTNIRFLNERK